MSSELGEILIASGALTDAQLREAMSHTRGGDRTLAEAVLDLSLCDESSLFRAIAKQNGMPFVDLDKGKPNAAILARVPSEVATDQGILPLMEKGGKLVVAVDDPFKRIIADQLSFVIGGEVACALSTPSAHKRAMQRFYGVSGGEENVAAAMSSSSDGDGDDAPIVRLVTRMFSDALAMRASDIHVEPGHGRVRVRYRVDGMLRDMAEHPEHLGAPLMSRLKIMARMDIAEKRKPQDGRIGLTISGRSIDVRASILPANHGETMVMRLLDRTANLMSLRDLGFSSEDNAWFKKVISRPNGIVLVTGPTGSGKTTTLYAALQELNRSDVKIITAEDPVEYHISGLNQVQVFDKIGLSFARILKAMLRCAPNIILVGEIRDLETAEIAIQAALTGHLVFSTLHTNDAPSALTRLSDLGVKPFLVSASVNAVLAQRLVRRLCSCAKSYDPDPTEIESIGLEPASVTGQFRGPVGCRECEGSGYRGRVALYERLFMDSNLRDMTFRETPLDELRSSALSTGALRGLIRDGARKVTEGVTTVTEVLRVCRRKD
ncbi:MAG: GspE/PulE family protein [Planctomycetota bacterium]|nr:GspE/PulE family protein [Planctomycetota bacterium]